MQQRVIRATIVRLLTQRQLRLECGHQVEVTAEAGAPAPEMVECPDCETLNRTRQQLASGATA